MKNSNEMLFDRFFNTNDSAPEYFSPNQGNVILAARIQKLLNTRKQHFLDDAENNRDSMLANYGLFDFGRFNPRSNQDKLTLERILEQTLQKFEPELQNVKVSFFDTHSVEMGLCFKVEAKVVQSEKNVSLFLQFDQAMQHATLEQAA